VSRDVTTPLSGTVCRSLAGTSYDQPVTKYEFSMFIHYEDMKATKNAKIGVVGELGVTETSPFDRAHMTSYSTLIETMRLSCTIFEL